MNTLLNELVTSYLLEPEFSVNNVKYILQTKFKLLPTAFEDAIYNFILNETYTLFRQFIDQVNNIINIDLVLEQLQKGAKHELIDTYKTIFNIVVVNFFINQKDFNLLKDFDNEESFIHNNDLLLFRYIIFKFFTGRLRGRLLTQAIRGPKTPISNLFVLMHSILEASDMIDFTDPILQNNIGYIQMMYLYSLFQTSMLIYGLNRDKANLRTPNTPIIEASKQMYKNVAKLFKMQHKESIQADFSVSEVCFSYSLAQMLMSHNASTSTRGLSFKDQIDTLYSPVDHTSFHGLFALFEPPPSIAASAAASAAAAAGPAGAAPPPYIASSHRIIFELIYRKESQFQHYMSLINDLGMIEDVHNMVLDILALIILRNPQSELVNEKYRIAFLAFIMQNRVLSDTSAYSPETLMKIKLRIELTSVGPTSYGGLNEADIKDKLENDNLMPWINTVYPAFDPPDAPPVAPLGAPPAPPDAPPVPPTAVAGTPLKYKLPTFPGGTTLKVQSPWQSLVHDTSDLHEVRDIFIKELFGLALCIHEEYGGYRPVRNMSSDKLQHILATYYVNQFYKPYLDSTEITTPTGVADITKLKNTLVDGFSAAFEIYQTEQVDFNPRLSKLLKVSHNDTFQSKFGEFIHRCSQQIIDRYMMVPSGQTYDVYETTATQKPQYMVNKLTKAQQYLFTNSDLLVSLPP
jgi:hypothetical protein